MTDPQHPSLCPTAGASFTVVSLVLSWVDYGNATLSGVPAYAISRLQSALNAAARLVFSLQKYDSVTLLNEYEGG